MTNSLPQQFTLTEYLSADRIAEALRSPLLENDHAQRLALLYRLAKAHHGEIQVRYTRKKIGEMFSGRYFPDGKFLTGTYQWRALRSFLYADNETDIDAKSCHPTILLYLAKKHGLDATMLSQYVDDRDHFIGDLDLDQADIDRYNDKEHADYALKDLGKLVFTSLMYGAGMNKIKASLYLDKSPLRRDSDADKLAREIKRLSNALSALEEYKDYKKNLPKKGLHAGKILSYIINDIEVQIVLDLMERFKAAGIQPTIYMYDGFQVLSQDNDKIDAVLRAFDNVAGLTFIRKPFSTSLMDITGVPPARSSLQVEELLDSLSTMVGLTDMHCAQLFLDKHDGLDLEKCNGSVITYQPDRGVWIDGGAEILLMHDDIAITDGEKVQPNYVQNATGFDRVKKYVKPMLQTLPNTEIIAELNRATIGKLFFRNGWVDLRDGTTGTHCHPRETAFWKINRDMPDWREYSMEHPDVQELLERGLNIFEADQLKVVLWAIARAAAGHVTDKNVFLIPGLRDSGKGVLSALMESALGIFPHGLCTHMSIPMQKDIETGDAKSRSWFLASHMHLARIAISNELIGKTGRKVDGNTIKALASGGDKIKARLNHKDERDEANNCTCFFFFNPPTYGGLPTFEPADALQKCTLFEMPFCFTDDEEKLKSAPIYKRADPNIKQWISGNTRMANAFVWLLMHHYQTRPLNKADLPEDYKKDNEEKDEIADNQPMTVFNRHFVLDPEGFCVAQEFRDIMQLSSQKATAWLKKNLKGKLVDYSTKTERINGNSTKVYFGFKKRRDEAAVETPCLV